MQSAPTRTAPLTILTLVVALILAATNLLIPTLNVLLLIFAGVLFGVLINGIASALSSRTGQAYRYSYFAVTATFLLLLVLGFYYLGSQAVQRADELWTQLQTAMNAAQDRVEESRIAQNLLPESFKMHEMLAQQSSTALEGLLSGMLSLLAAVTGAFVILFVGLYAAYEPGLYRTGIVKLVAMPSRGRAMDVLEQLHSALTRWMIGRLASMSIVGVLTAIGLYSLDVPMPVTLGVIAALLTFLPNFGPLLAAVPQVLLALNVGTSTAVYVIIFNVVLQGVESYLITPLIQRHEVALPPILTIAAQLLMGTLVGVVGVMMAAPLVVMLMVVIQMLYIEDSLGDPDPGELVSGETASEHPTRSNQ